MAGTLSDTPPAMSPGRYTAAMLAELVGVPVSRVRAWQNRGWLVPSEETHRLVPPGAGDVPLGVQGGEGEWVGPGLGGVGHRTMVPDGRAGRRGTLLATVYTGGPPTAGRGEL